MKPEDQTFLRSHLQKSQASFEDTIATVDRAMWTAEPAPGRWSVSLCAEHVVTVSERVFVRVQALADMPEESFNAADSARKDELVLMVAERQQRVSAPAAIHPTAKYNSPEALLAAFRDVYRKMIDLAEQNPAWLRGRFLPHPVLQKLDGYQWIVTASCHTLRHVAQIREIQEQLAV